MYSVRNNFCRYVAMFSVLFIAACSTGHGAHQGDVAMADKVADIENEPITRLSFVPTQDEYDHFEIVLYQDGEELSDIMPASGQTADRK